MFLEYIQVLSLLLFREIPQSQVTTEPPVIISMSRSLDTQALPEGPAGENTYLFAPLDEGKIFSLVNEDKKYTAFLYFNFTQDF